MERRVIFSGWVCPAVLLMPQLAVTIVFFFWPAGQAVLQSLRGGDAFGLETRFVGLTTSPSSLPTRITSPPLRSPRFSALPWPCWRWRRGSSWR